MPKFSVFTFGFLVSILAQSAFSANVQFINKDTAVATKNNQSLYLYEGRSARNNSTVCWTMLQVQKSENGTELVGSMNNLFDYSQSQLAEENLQSKVNVDTQTGQIVFQVNRDAYSSQFNLDSEGGLAAYVLNTRISKVKELMYGLNSETHIEYRDVTCANLKNVTDVKKASSEVRGRILQDIENFQK